MMLLPEPAHSAMRVIEGYGLHGVVTPAAPVPDESWRSLLWRIVDERVTGLALAAEEGDALTLTSRQHEDLLERHTTAMLWALTLERELLRLGDALDETGVASVVLKGPALANTMYPDPAWRSFGDLDLLVMSADLRTILEILEGRGFRRRLPEPRAGFDERFGKGVELRNASGVDIDLHRTLALGSFGIWLDPEALFERTASFSLGDRTFRRLDAEALMVHASIHAALGSRYPRLVALRDVAQIAQTAEPDWREVGDLGRAWHMQVVIASALRAASTRFGWPIPAEAEPILYAPTSGRERRALAAYARGTQRSDALALSSLGAIRGFRDKAAYARAMLLPSREFLSARASDQMRASYVRRWLSPLRRRFGPS